MGGGLSLAKGRVREPGARGEDVAWRGFTLADHSSLLAEGAKQALTPPAPQRRSIPCLMPHVTTRGNTLLGSCT